MAEGIIFGGHLLSKEEFIPIFEQFYEQKGQQFLIELQQLKLEIESMIVKELSQSASNPNIEKMRTHRTATYNAQIIYNRWEQIQKNYFGNSAVTLIAIISFDGENLTWSKNIDESQFMTSGGINVTAAQFESMFKSVEAAAAASQVQDFLRLHYAQLCNQLSSYTLSIDEASSLHRTIPKKSALYTNRLEHFTGRTYGDIIFATQGNREGKQLDAFMNHIGQYNKQLFGLMSAGVANKNALESLKLDTHNEFLDIFTRPNIVQPWLLASLNSASWLTGGDVVVIDDSGAVVYNIQIKSTMGGKNFELALTRLLSLISRIIKKTESSRFRPKQLANIIYNALKTSSSNEIQKTESFLTDAAYRMVEKNLGLKFT